MKKIIISFKKKNYYKFIKSDKIINANLKILNRKGNHLNGYFTRQKRYR